MAGDNQTTAQAKKAVFDYLTNLLKIVNNYKETGDCDSYYNALGDAFHAVQDQWAQLHNYSRWDGSWISDLHHIITELNPSTESLMNTYMSSIILLSGNVAGAMR